MDDDTRVTTQLCAYGCGEPAAFRVGKKLKPCCSKSQHGCPAVVARTTAARRANGRPIGFQHIAAREAAAAALLSRYGVVSPGASKEFQERARATNQERYGVTNPFAREDVKERIRQTNLTRYGVENISGLDEIKERRRATCEARFNAGNPQQSPEIRAKTAATNQGRYGGVAPLCDPKVRAQAVATAFSRYGSVSEQPWHSPVARAKRRETLILRFGVNFMRSLVRGWGKTHKTYVFPSGRKETVMGYEPEALDALLAQGVPEDDIFVGRGVPRIPYTHMDEWGHTSKHTYWPDIFVKSWNLLIEVKSLWTYQGGRKEAVNSLGIGNPVYERNQEKHWASRMAGYRHQFWIKGDDGVWVITRP